jgi:hypothetical protein
VVEQISVFPSYRFYFLELVYFCNLHAFDHLLPIFFLCDCYEDILPMLCLLSCALLHTFTFTYLVVSLSCLSVQFNLLSIVFSNCLAYTILLQKTCFFEVFVGSPITPLSG